MFTLQLSDEAISDYDDAVGWYEYKKQGLGLEFSVQLTEVFEKIEANPTAQNFLYENRRFTKLKQFPYKVFFLVDEINGEIIVFAILHEKRHPDIWKNRSDDV